MAGINIYSILKQKGIKFSNTIAIRASYIMSNGKFMDLEGFKSELGVNRVVQDRDLFLYCLRENLVPKPEPEFVLRLDNAIRINDGVTGGLHNENASISLPLKPLSKKQYTSLFNWLNYVFDVSDFVEVGIFGKRNIMTYDFNNWSADDIISDIEHFYNSIAGMDVESMIK